MDKSKEQRPICENCKQEIDPECCWCGSKEHSYNDNHFFVPMGCVCYFAKHIDQAPID